MSATAASFAVPELQPFLALSSHTPFTGTRLKHLSEFAPPCSPSQRQRYAEGMSAKAASLAVPAEQPLRTLSSQTPSTGSSTRLKHLPELAPPCSPSQRQRYAVEMSAKASSLAVPAEQPLRTLSSHAPSIGTSCRRMKHLPELAPPCSPSQRQRYPVDVSAKASSLTVPAEQPLRTLSLHTPSTGTRLKHLSEFAPPCSPSQRQRYAVGMSAKASSLAVPAEQPLRTLSSQTPSIGSCAATP